MNIQEAIEHCNEVINSNECEGCKQEHEQLKEWLAVASVLEKKDMTGRINWIKEEISKIESKLAEFISNGIDDKNDLQELHMKMYSIRKILS